MSPHFERALRFAEMQQNGHEPSKMHDWTLSQLHSLALEFQETHDRAIYAAARRAEESGAADLAEAITALKVDR